MISNTTKDSGAAFDYSCNVPAHGIPVPQHYQGCCLTLHPTWIMAYANNNIVESGENAFNFLAVKPNQSDLSESSGTSSTEDYYPVEYSNFKSFVNQNFLEDFTSIGNERNIIREISASKERLEPQWPMSMKTIDECSAQKIEQWIYSAEKLSSEEMFWKEMKENPHLFELWLNGRALKEKSFHQCPLKYENMGDESSEGLSENPSDNCDEYHWNSFEHYTSKRRHCRHFQKGHCRKGRTCNFLHDQSTLCPSSQKVFLGGLPAHITEFTLRVKLAQYGYRVINKPRVLRGFAPHICMGSVEEAQELIAKKSILIDGSFVDVRAYVMSTEGNKQSVFLGGLSKGTTCQMIKDDLKKMNVEVVNHPVIKMGFSPKVTLSTVKESNKLLTLKKVLINKTMVDVRQYVNRS